VEAPATQPSLLVRLRDARDREAWARFVDLYAPVVYRFARRRGLQDADAADLTQTVLLQVARAIGGFDYDPARGSFRGWLFTLVSNQLRKAFGRSRPGGRGSGDTDVQRLLEAEPAPAEDPLESWEGAWRRQTFAWAAAQVRASCGERTWRAFWQTAALGRPGKEVAAELGMTPAAVYLAKGRVMARLKQLIQEANDD
jgi:RNA polymerase sigma-70 factor (ECF subfamily)